MKMEQPESEQSQHVSQFSGDEFLSILGVAETFTEKGAVENPPKFVIFMGGVASGKTTIRRQNFSTGYVNFDFGEIHLALEKTVGKSHPRLSEYAAMASDMVLRQALSEKKNIVIEIIGDRESIIKPVIDKMRGIGYDISIQGVTADIAESYKRHLQAVEQDPDYISAAHTQELTLGYFFNYFDLGTVPKS